MENKLLDLIEKVQNDTATPADESILLELLNTSVSSLRLLLKEVKIKQIKAAITNSNLTNI